MAFCGSNVHIGFGVKGVCQLVDGGGVWDGFFASGYAWFMVAGFKGVLLLYAG